MSHGALIKQAKKKKILALVARHDSWRANSVHKPSFWAETFIPTKQERKQTRSPIFTTFVLVDFSPQSLQKSYKFVLHNFVFALAQSTASVFTNYPLLSALVAFALAQSIKVFTSWYKEGRWDLKQPIGSGGMPSSHSATVTGLAAAIGFKEGFEGSLFATSLILACIVMYDAFGVRLQAGRQAEVLNQIVYELPAEHPLADSRPLRELLGHTPSQVIAGGLLGIVTASIGYLIAIGTGSR